MKHLDAIETVLRAAAEPMSAKAIADEAIRKGLITEYGKTLHSSFNCDLNQDIAKGGRRFVKRGKGLFAVTGSAAVNVQPELARGVGHSAPTPAADLLRGQGLKMQVVGKKDARKRRCGKGFVYIMTNPSFKKSWIKIGYTAAGETVEQRRRSLSNSSVPYPFEVFATLRSDNAYDTEQRVHLALEAGGDSRLTPNREFFDLSPERALKAFMAIASEEAIDIYRDGKVVAHGLDVPVEKGKRRRRKIPTPKSGNIVLYCTASGADAKGVETDDGFVVLRGSRLAKIQPSMAQYAKSVYARRVQLEKEGVIVAGILKRQQSFSSPSAAACFVSGRNADGLHDWRTEDGTKLGQMKREK